MRIKQMLAPLAMALGIPLLTVITAYSQGDIMYIKDSAFKNPTRPPVRFNHDAHNEKAGIFECNVCHHIYENGEKLEFDASIGMECSQCHLPSGESDPMELIRAYHLQCKRCHLRQAAGPVLCGECHQKPKR